MSANVMTAVLPLSILEHAGLTYRQMRILLVLSALKNDCPDALYPRRDWLGKRVGMHPNSVSIYARVLVEKGLVLRDRARGQRWFELVNPFEGER